MKCFSITEFGRIPRTDFTDKEWRLLRRFDTSNAKKNRDTVFDWDHATCLRAKNYVGVIQVGNITIEVLPKVDNSEKSGTRPAECAHHNLLYMLSLTRNVPLRDREIAALRKQRMPLNESLIAVFARRVIAELQKGLVRSYVYREENLQVVKGRILTGTHVRKNAAHQERVYVGYDEYLADNLLNRILKAGCQRLLCATAVQATQQKLRVALVHLAEVADCEIQDHDFDQVHYTRNSERMEVLIVFCRMLFSAAAPSPSQGVVKSFSLLFPMETLFEEFVARFIKRYADQLGLHRSLIHPQSRGRCRYLLRMQGSPKFQLRPDLLVERRRHEPALIIDTKWKHLKTDEEDSRNGVKQSDLYQMFAYAHRYDCLENILLYPKVPGVSAKAYDLEGDSQGRRIHVEFLDVSYDLRNNRERLLSDIKQIISKCRDIGGQEGVEKDLGYQAGGAIESVVTKKRTRQEMHQFAEQKGVGEHFAELFNQLSSCPDQLEISKRSITYKCKLRESGKLSSKSVIEIDVAKSSSEKGLFVQVMFDRLARHLGVHRNTIFDLLPAGGTRKEKLGKKAAGAAYRVYVTATDGLDPLIKFLAEVRK